MVRGEYHTSGLIGSIEDQTSPIESSNTNTLYTAKAQYGGALPYWALFKYN